MSENSNLDLGGLPVRDVNTQEPQTQSVEDPADKFDVTRKARQDALKMLAQLLTAAEGAKLSKKDVIKGFRALHEYCLHSDYMISAMVHDMYRIVHSVAQGEVNTFALRTNLKTLVKALELKDLVNQEELKEIHDQQVLPGELPPGTTDEQVAELKAKQLTETD